MLGYASCPACTYYQIAAVRCCECNAMIWTDAQLSALLSAIDAL